MMQFFYRYEENRAYLRCLALGKKDMLQCPRLWPGRKLPKKLTLALHALGKVKLARSFDGLLKNTKQ